MALISDQMNFLIFFLESLKRKKFQSSGISFVRNTERIREINTFQLFHTFCVVSHMYISFEETHGRSNCVHIEHIKCYNNFFTGETNKICSHIFSDIQDWSIIVESDSVLLGPRRFENVEATQWRKETSTQDIL